MLVYHVWPAILPGGYVGVDVFFVISGFLITSLLLRDLERSGVVSFRAFYLRRARRLLPASLVTLAAILIVSWVEAPALYWADIGRHVTASLFYAENWLLGVEAVDYLSLDASPGPTQHFWSLSVEEQFYLGWPILVLLVYRVGRAMVPDARRATLAGLGGVISVSLGWSIYVAITGGSVGYFSTFTRIWELGIGAALACLGCATAGGRRATAVNLLGVIGIIAAGLALNDATRYPGYAACLPVFGTALLIWGGAHHARSIWTRWLGWRPFQFIGDISYSLYLVHWPVIVFWRMRTGWQQEAPTAAEGLSLIAVSITLAAINKRWIEDRFRHPGSRGRNRGFVTAAVCATGLCAAAALALHHRSTLQHRLISFAPGAAVMLQRGPLEPPDAEFVPALANVAGDIPSAYAERCFSRLDEVKVETCTYGRDGAAVRIAVIGDSHALHWLPAFKRFTDFMDVQIIGIAKTNCPFAEVVVHNKKLDRELWACKEWARAVVEYLETEKFDYAVISQSPKHRVEGIKTRNPRAHTEAIATSMAELLARLASTGTEVVALRSTPWQPVMVRECVAANRPPYEACTAGPDSTILPGAPEVAARQNNLRVLDLTDLFCRDGRCPAVIGDVFVYRDAHHLTATYARTIGPILMYRLVGDRAR